MSDSQGVALAWIIAALQAATFSFLLSGLTAPVGGVNL
jgi:hypothetical protein